jgi:predicted MFS family arabinose efflux permease
VRAALARLTPVDRSEAAVLAVTFLSYLAMGVYGPLLPSIQTEFAAGAGDVGLLISSYALGRLVTALPAGRYLTRFEPGLALVGSSFVTALGSVLSAVASDLPTLVAFQFVRGFGLTGMVVVILAYLGAISTPSTSSQVFGRFFLAQLASLSLSPALVGLASVWWPWRAVFLASAVGPLLAGIGVWAFTRTPGFWLSPRATAPAVAAAGSAWTTWQLCWPAYLANFLTLFVYAGVLLALFPLFGAQALAMGPDALGLALGLTAWAMVVGTYTSTVIADRVGKMHTLALGYAMLLAVVLPILAPSTAILILALALVHLGVGLTASLPTAMLSDRLPAAQLGNAIGIIRAAADIGWLVAPTVIGIVLDAAGFAAAFWLSAGLAAIGLAVFLRKGRSR